MAGPSNDVLLEKIANLSEKIEEGFATTHEKQNYTNGNVMKNTEFRIKTQSSIDTFKWIAGFLGLGNIVMLISFFYNKF